MRDNNKHNIIGPPKQSWSVEPIYTSSRIKAAGKRIRKSEATEEDWLVFENHRRAHSRTLNTHQMRLRRISENLDFSVAQRLKRRPTIIDKLKREPNMQLSTMHDIAGCRVIFNNLSDLHAYREIMNNKPVKHIHINKGTEHFDYLKHPKKSGYRGIHEIFKTRTGRTDAKAWDGLMIEVQLRTKAQHAWATAVETIDLLSGERAKFGEAAPKLSRFFVLASEIIARVHENSKSSLPKIPDKEIKSEFISLDKQLGVINRLSEAVQEDPTLTVRKPTILIFHFDEEKSLEVRSYKNFPIAVRSYEELENEYRDKADIVLVRAERVEDLRRSFQNYFSDAKDFVHLINTGITKLG